MAQGPPRTTSTPTTPTPAPQVVTCERCGRRNRVPAVATGRPKCGNCGAPLPWVAVADEDTFDSVVGASPVPVVVDLWAPWCGPCRMVSPALDEVARNLAGRVKLVKVNIDEATALARRFSVQAVPTLLIMGHGEVVSRRAGAAPAAVLRAWVEEALAGNP